MTYKTKDFYLSAFLLASGLSMISNKRQAGITTFEFEQSAQLVDLVAAYYAQRAIVNPMTYGNALKNLKCVIHANTDENNYAEAINS